MKSKNKYEPGTDIIMQSANRLGKNTIVGAITSKAQMKYAIECGLSEEEIMDKCAISQAITVYKSMYKLCVQEFWEENELIKTKAGRLLYV